MEDLTETEESARDPRPLAERLRSSTPLYNRGKDYSPIMVEPGPLRLEAADRIEELEETVSKFHRLLNPVWMALTYTALGGDPLGDEEIIFSHMGGGGSDMTTVGEFRAVMGDERKAVAEMEAEAAG